MCYHSEEAVSERDCSVKKQGNSVSYKEYREVLLRGPGVDQKSAAENIDMARTQGCRRLAVVLVAAVGMHVVLHDDVPSGTRKSYGYRRHCTHGLRKIQIIIRFSMGAVGIRAGAIGQTFWQTGVPTTRDRALLAITTTAGHI